MKETSYSLLKVPLSLITQLVPPSVDLSIIPELPTTILSLLLIAQIEFKLLEVI